MVGNIAVYQPRNDQSRTYRCYTTLLDELRLRFWLPVQDEMKCSSRSSLCVSSAAAQQRNERHERSCASQHFTVFAVILRRQHA